MTDLLPKRADAIIDIDHWWLLENALTVLCASCFPVRIDVPLSSALLGWTRISSIAARRKQRHGLLWICLFLDHILAQVLSDGFAWFCACDWWWVIFTTHKIGGDKVVFTIIGILFVSSLFPNNGSDRMLLLKCTGQSIIWFIEKKLRYPCPRVCLVCLHIVSFQYFPSWTIWWWGDKFSFCEVLA